MDQGAHAGLLGESCLPLAIWIAERIICKEDLEVGHGT